MDNNNKIKQIMKICGLPLTGIAEFSRIQNHLLDCRGISRIPPNACSVIMTAVSYNLGEFRGNVARFAAVPDYHIVLMNMLESAISALSLEFPGHKFAAFTDNSPIPEVSAARLSGLGIIGKNGLLITPNFGSFVIIGEIITTISAEVDSPSVGECMNCGNCTKNCPRPKSITDKSLCISGITQKKGELFQAEQAYIKSAKSAWGCDLCQSICPHNSTAETTWIPEFWTGFDPVISLNTPVEGRVFAWRGIDVISRNLQIINSE